MVCERCEGTGEVPSPYHEDYVGYEDYMDCPDCNGTGIVEGAKNTEQQVQPDNGKKTGCRWGKTERCEYRPLSCPDCTMPLQVN